MAKRKGYKYASLQYKGHCFAGNSFGKYGEKVPDIECGMQCRKDEKGRLCGGAWRNSVFDISKVGEEEQNNDTPKDDGTISLPKKAMNILVESTSELKSNLETISNIVASTMDDQQIWKLLDDDNSELEGVKRDIEVVGLGFTKAMHEVKKMADDLQ